MSTPAIDSTANLANRCVALTGLRDRAFIGITIYTFARVGAVLQMKVGDYFSRGRGGADGQLTRTIPRTSTSL
jgi:hypothetical protein